MTHFITYMDILGFENIPKMLSLCSGFDENTIRQKFISEPLLLKVDDICQKNYVKDKSELEKGADSYIIKFENMVALLKALKIFSTIKIPHKCYGNIPIEIALDIIPQTESDVSFTNNSAVINALKKNILSPYKEIFKRNHHGVSIRDTFIVVTRKFYDSLDYFDKNACLPIEGEDSYLFDLEIVHNRCNIFNFLESLGLDLDDELYNRIDELYVEPNEYPNIKDSLKNEKVLFLTGTAQYGKTYTAIRLLWEFFLEGYKPKWIKGSSSQQRETCRQKLHRLSNEIEEKEIIYFEDPFGLFEYDGAGDRLEDFMALPDIMQDFEDAFVIITSRGEIFNEYKKSVSNNFKQYEKSLNIKIPPSYDLKQRLKILSLWAANKNCEWLQIPELKEYVFNELNNDSILLPTPLTIFEFTKSTFKLTDKALLKEELIKASDKHPWTFANEIKRMNDNKILFLSYPFISNEFSVDFIKKEYNDMINQLNLEDMEFNEILNHFKDFKIKISDSIQFYHSTYNESLKHILMEHEEFSRINKRIFCPVLMSLSKKENVAPDVIKIMISYFGYLPNTIHNRLLELSKCEKYTKFIIDNFFYFNRLNFTCLKKIIENLLENEDTIHYLAKTFRNNFNYLSDKIINFLLKKLIKFPDAHKELKIILKDNFKEIDAVIREELLSSLLTLETSFDLTLILMKYFDEISNKNNILCAILKYENVLENLFRILFSNFKQFPQSSIEDLLIELYKFEDSHSNIALFLKDNFSNFSNIFRNELLRALSLKNDFSEEIAFILSNHINLIPTVLINELLGYLSLKNDFNKEIAFILLNHFDFIDELLRYQLIIDLSKKEEAQLIITETIVYNYRILPNNIQNIGNQLLIDLSQDNEIQQDIALMISNNFFKLPKLLRNQLIIDLSKKDESRLIITETIVYNYRILPKYIQKLLIDLIDYNLDSIEFLIRDLLIILIKYNKKQGIQVLNDLMHYLDKNFVLDVLKILSDDENQFIYNNSKLLIDDINFTYFP